MRMKFLSNLPRSAWINTPSEQWQDWAWQMRNAFSTPLDFQKHFTLTPDEMQGFEGQHQNQFQVKVTPYYAQLAHPINDKDPIRKIFMPHRNELNLGLQEMSDPLNEKKNATGPRIIHRYADRVLFLVTDVCSVYCRYCTRKHFTGNDEALVNDRDFEQAVKYIKDHPGIREVILSGGDPLTLSDGVLDRILSRLRAIDHVEIIRIGSRIPVVNPFRIHKNLALMLRKHNPVFLMTHFNHPREITSEAARALEILVDHGIPVFNQMVLLNGVNNHEVIVQALSRRLLFLRVKPYYMFQCDPSLGTDHLRTSVEDSERIQRELWGHLSGLAMPTLSLDIPRGGGKTSLVPNFEIASPSQERHARGSHSERVYRGFDGVIANYVNPLSAQIEKPCDIEVYLDEWLSLKNAKKSQSEDLTDISFQ